MASRRIMVALALLGACGSGTSLPVQPQIATTPTGLYFGTDLCLGTCLGAAPENSLQIINGGQDPLTIASITPSLPAVFTMSTPLFPLPDGGLVAATSGTILSQQQAFVRVIFDPLDGGKFEGSITIDSNAQNSPSLVVPVRGAGIPGCLPDGNFLPQPDDGGSAISPDCTGDAGQTS